LRTSPIFTADEEIYCYFASMAIKSAIYCKYHLTCSLPRDHFEAEITLRPRFVSLTFYTYKMSEPVVTCETL